MDGKQYLSSMQVIESPRYPFSKGQLNHLLSLRHRNGLNKVVRKIGKRIYWRADLLDAWIDQHACKGGR